MHEKAEFEWPAMEEAAEEGHRWRSGEGGAACAPCVRLSSGDEGREGARQGPAARPSVHVAAALQAIASETPWPPADWRGLGCTAASQVHSPEAAWPTAEFASPPTVSVPDPFAVLPK